MTCDRCLPPGRSWQEDMARTVEWSVKSSSRKTCLALLSARLATAGTASHTRTYGTWMVPKK